MNGYEMGRPLQRDDGTKRMGVEGPPSGAMEAEK